MSEVENMNVYQRIHAVMREMEVLQKNGRNTFQNYNYVTEADYVKALRPLLDKYRLVIIPRVASETVRVDDGLTTAVVNFDVVNVDNPTQTVSLSILAQGKDSGDKGAYKLLTGAKKYMASLTFMVATGDDPEKDEPKSRTLSSKRGRSVAETEDDEF